MDFYEKKRKAGIDLAAWIRNDNREPFNIFSRQTLETYGFDRETMLRILETNYPEFKIKDNLLEKA